jgi:arylsulfatase A-like enzyme
MVGKWHLGHDPVDHLPTRRGFDSYFGLLYSNDMIPPWVKTDRPLRLYRDTEPLGELGDQSDLTARYTDEALSFIRAGGAPYFLYLPYAMPHLPISAPARFRGKSRAGLYGDVVETIDWSVGEILKAVDDNTLVVFTSDNGPWHDLPSRMLQNGVEPWYTGSKNLLRGAKGSTWEGGLREPFIARWRGVIPAGQVSADMASTLDLFPTIAGAAGAAMPADRVYDGSDIMPFLRGQAPSPRRDFFYFSGPNCEGLREGSWKVRRARGSDKAELFNVDVDPAEMYDQFGGNREMGERMLSRMRDFEGQLAAR